MSQPRSIASESETRPSPRWLRLHGTAENEDVRLALSPGTHHLGSGRDCDLRLERDGVSRRHAVLVAEPGRLRLIDAGSKNGTFVNGTRVRRAEVRPGDLVTFGPVSLRVEELEAEDGELAVEGMPEAMPDSASSVMSAGTDADATQTEDERRGGRGSRVESLARSLQATPGELGGALEELRAALEADGVAALDPGGDGTPPALVAAAGKVAPEAAELASAAWHCRRRGSRRARLRQPGVAAVMTDLSGSPRGLVVSGAAREPPAGSLSSWLAVLELGWPAREPAVARADPAALRFPDGLVRCASPAMTSLYQQMRPLVGNDLPVLIVGETGVGKEHLAQTLHRSSPRGRGPLVAINCAAIPAELLEAELFGIGDRVATGVAARRGRFQQADGGTLFLDEIGEMPRNLQAKLLRALDEKHVHPVGAGPVPVDVRVLSATNVDLYRRMEVGQIRRDLFFRLAGYLLEVPPLRSRPEDVPLLAEHFLNRFSREANKRIRGLTVRAMNALAAYEWPGNVRELEHEMRRLVYLCPKGQAIEAGMLADHFRRGEAADSTAASQGAEEDEESAEAAGEPRLPTLNLEQLDLLAIEQAMARSGGRVAEAARSLGISRYTLRRRLQRSGIQD